MSSILKLNQTEFITIFSYDESFDSPILVRNLKNDRAFICSSIDNSLNQEIIKQKIKINGFAVSVLDDEWNKLL